MRLLLLSNSRSADGAYLRWPREHLVDFLGKARALFIPYAAVPARRATFDGYFTRVRQVFEELGLELHSIHDAADAAAAVRKADAVVVGGGNTFHLLAQIYEHELLEALAARVRAGMAYVGWSAGANLACPGIWTTNDMPIIEPRSLRALDVVPFQINPHFTDANPVGHQGETRSERIAEFLATHPEATVVGLREGALLRIEGVRTTLHGAGARVFSAGGTSELGDGEELSIAA